MLACGRARDPHGTAPQPLSLRPDRGTQRLVEMGGLPAVAAAPQSALSGYVPRTSRPLVLAVVRHRDAVARALLPTGSRSRVPTALECGTAARATNRIAKSAGEEPNDRYNGSNSINPSGLQLITPALQLYATQIMAGRSGLWSTYRPVRA